MHDVEIDKLGPFLIIQLAVAIVVLVGLALSVYRATRDKKADPQLQLGADQRFFIDGPIMAVLTLLREIRDLMHRVEVSTSATAEQGRANERLLDEIRDIAVEIKDEGIRRRR